MLADYEALVEKFTRDDAARLLPADYDSAIDLAVKRYSKDRERIKVEDVATTAANVLPLPAAWEDEISELRSLEVPIGNVPPTYLEQDRYRIYQDPAGKAIQLDDAQNVGTQIRVNYTISHLVDAATDSIPVKDREPVACWAAAICCDQLAAFYSGGSDSTIQADSAPGQSKAQEYAARAKTLRTRYLNEIGVDDKSSAPAGVHVNLDTPSSLNQDRLLHSRIFR